MEHLIVGSWAHTFSHRAWTVFVQVLRNENPSESHWIAWDSPSQGLNLHQDTPWWSIIWSPGKEFISWTSLPSDEVHQATAWRVSHLQIGAVVLGDVWTVALTEDSDLLLDILDLVLGLLQVNGLDGHNRLRAIIDAFKHLPNEEIGERALILTRSITPTVEKKSGLLENKP